MTMSMRSRRTVARGFSIGAIVAVLLQSTPVAAKNSDPDVTMRRLEKRISRETKIRLETAATDHELVHPRLVEGTLSSPDGPITFQLDDVEEIRAYRAYTGRGIGLGILAGVAAGALLGAYASALSESGQDTSSDETIGLMAAGGAVGGLLGGLVGAASSGWKRIYQRPAGPRD